MNIGSVEFSHIARTLNRHTQHLQGASISFRAPPSDPKVNRSLRKRDDGSVVIAVALKNRSREDIIADLIDGICAANSHIENSSLREILDDAGNKLLG